MKLDFLLLLMLFLSCEGRKQPNSVEPFIITEPDIVSKLEQLLSLSQDSVLDYYDLSNDLLTKFPDLSGYTIKSLNLSHNYLDTILMLLLPHGLTTLNLSYNNIQGGYYRKGDKSVERLNLLEELNLSHNNITYIVTFISLRKLDVSYNNLETILSHSLMRYIDISNNLNLSNILQFDPTKIDTIIHDNIANAKKLRWIGTPDPSIIY